MTATPLATPFTTPIRAPLEEGDLTYRPNYRRLADEVEKGRRLDGGTPDWKHVQDEGTRILQEEAKDLRVGAWVVVAKAHLEGWNGALDGLAAFAALVDGFWDVLLPSRPRARVSLVDWLWEGLARALHPRAVAPEDRPTLDALAEAAERLNQLLVERTKQGSDGAGDFRRVVRDALATVVDAPPPAAPQPATIEEVAPAPAPVPRVASPPAVARLPAPALAIDVPAAEAPTSLEHAERVAATLRDPIGSLARHVRELSPQSPLSYRLARVSAWFTIDEAPYVERGRTELRAPPAGDRELLERFARDRAWADLRDASEAALSEHIFWLDVHRYTTLALENLGPAYVAARAAVSREAISFLERVPGLEPLVFSNGTPLANPQTRSWIDRERERRPGGDAHPGGASVLDEQFEKLVESARSRVGTEGEGALSEVLASAQAPRSKPARFLATFAAAKLAMDAGKREAALALFGRLYPEVDATLEAWQPDVCKRFFEGYLEALGGAEEGSSRGRRQAALFRRLLGLDPALAFRYGADK
jgi:type VI secretion system protein VasJ